MLSLIRVRILVASEKFCPFIYCCFIELDTIKCSCTFPSLKYCLHNYVCPFCIPKNANRFAKHWYVASTGCTRICGINGLIYVLSWYVVSLWHTTSYITNEVFERTNYVLDKFPRTYATSIWHLCIFHRMCSTHLLQHCVMLIIRGGSMPKHNTNVRLVTRWVSARKT